MMSILDDIPLSSHHVGNTVQRSPTSESRLVQPELTLQQLMLDENGPISLLLSLSRVLRPKVGY